MRLDEIDRSLRMLDDVPRGLWLPLLGNGVGVPAARLLAIAALRAALLKGELPAAQIGYENDVFDHCFCHYFRSAIGELRLSAFAREREDSTDQIIRTLLWHMDRIAGYQDRFGENFPAAAKRAEQAFRAEWHDTVDDWAEVFAVFDSLGGLDLASDPSAMRGVLARADWQAIKHAHALVTQIPQLRKIIAALGRSAPIPAAQIFARVPVSVTETTSEMTPITHPMPIAQQGAEVVGVHRSNDLAAMLPSEALLRRRPILSNLWRARYVENGLLTYERHVTLDAPMPAPQLRTTTRIVMQPPPKHETGPIIVCVDTSSSMRGAKESLVKATVFEAMRVAHAQKRACYLFAFSDGESVHEHALALSVQGMHALMDFLALSFHGGTDIAEPITRAVGRVHAHAWREADILIASDGEFGVTPAIEAEIAAAKLGLSLRIQGVLAGDRETIGMRAICDDIFWIKDWRRFDRAHSSADSPVHATDLTARYFPNAMRAR